jgi:hypothetical protein
MNHAKVGIVVGGLLLAVTGGGMAVAEVTAPHPVPLPPAVQGDSYPVAETYDEEYCETLDAVSGVNDRLVDDGYAESYAEEYASLREAANCP